MLQGKPAYMAIWTGLISTQKQARKLISAYSPTAKDRLLSFTRTHSRAVTDLLTGHNTLIRLLYIMGQINSLLCKRCGTQEETSAHILCVKPWVDAETPIWAHLLDPDDVTSLSLGDFDKGTWLQSLNVRLWGTRCLSRSPTCIGDRKDSNLFSIPFYSILFYAMLVYSLSKSRD